MTKAPLFEKTLITVLATSIKYHQSSYISHNYCIGQFWNVPMTIQRYAYNGALPTVLDVENLYSVCVPEESAAARKFIAEYYTQKWDSSRDTCFYSGNIQGGTLLEIPDPAFNDPVIEGAHTDYIVDGLFQNSFKFSLFSVCNAAL